MYNNEKFFKIESLTVSLVCASIYTIQVRLINPGPSRSNVP